MERGSLADILSNTEAKELDWATRVRVIKGVAYALSYMHHDCLPPIIHRDISSKNVLLSSNLEACVSDFGTARFLKPNSSNWTTIAGTYGYLAPGKLQSLFLMIFLLDLNMLLLELCYFYFWDICAFDVILNGGNEKKKKKQNKTKQI